MDATKTALDLPQSEDYGTEVMCASWNPVVSAVAEPAGQACDRRLAERTTVEAESFLHQFYRCEGS